MSTNLLTFIDISRNILSIVDIDESSGEFIPGSFCRILSNGKVSSAEDVLGGYVYGYIYQPASPGTRTQVITLGQVTAINSPAFIPGENVLTNNLGAVKGFSSATDYDPGPIDGGDPNGNYRNIGIATSENTFIISRKLELEPILFSSLDRTYGSNQTINLQARVGIIRGDLFVSSGIELTVRSGNANSWAFFQVEGNITLESNAKIKLIRTILYCKGNIIASAGSKIYTVNGARAGRGGNGGDGALTNIKNGSINGAAGTAGEAMEVEYNISASSGQYGGGGGGGGSYSTIPAGSGSGGGGGAGSYVDFNITTGNYVYYSTDEGTIAPGAVGESGFGRGGDGGSYAIGKTGNGAFAGGGGGGTLLNVNTGATAIYSGGAGTGPSSEIDGHGIAAPTLSSTKYVNIGTNATRANRSGNKAGEGSAGVVPEVYFKGIKTSLGGSGGGGGPGGSDGKIATNNIFGLYTSAGGGGAGAPGTPTGGSNITIICFGTIDTDLTVQAGKGGARAERSIGGSGSNFFVLNNDGADSNITSHGGTGNIYFITPTLPGCTTDIAATTNSDLGVSYTDGLSTPVGPAGTVTHETSSAEKVNEVLNECLYNSKVSYTI